MELFVPNIFVFSKKILKWKSSPKTAAKDGKWASCRHSFGILDT
jgi:hypothetical protein